MDHIEKLGRYDIIRMLGQGAMGVVYEARDPNLDRVVAVKTIRIQSLTPEAAAEYEGRFRTEARSAARLHHPNIVSVFDSGQDGDIAYLVMEFIQGDDLKQHLESGARFSVPSSIVMVHELLMALDHAHRQNVVHRDIKPANMLMEVTGRIKLTDFGVARIQGADETNLTQVGGAVGTPKYMSPEQAKGLRGDSRSDIFSAAVVLYELLTGLLPFTGENQFIIIHQIVGHEPAPPSTLNPDVPLAMDEVMARAMAKNPDERYATAREFGLALRAVAVKMNAAGTHGPDVAAELGQILVNRPAGSSGALRDGSSTGIFGPTVDAALVSTVSHEAELAAWQQVKDSSDSQEFLNFLERFPSGIYARRAQNRVYQLGAGAALSPAKTEPQFRVPVEDSGFDSTVGHYAATKPMQTPDQTVPGFVGSDAVSVTAVPEPMHATTASTARRKKWVLGALASAAVALVVVGLGFKRSGLPEPQPNAPQTPQVSAAASLELSSESIVQPSTPRGAVPAAAVAASQPVAVLPGASRPIAKPKPVPGPTASATPSASSVPVEPAPAAQTQGVGSGPSRPGQVCAKETFLFKIKCIADQCTTDRYRHTPECIRFKEMEKEREEQRNSRR